MSLPTFLSIDRQIGEMKRQKHWWEKLLSQDITTIRTKLTKLILVNVLRIRLKRLTILGLIHFMTFSYTFPKIKVDLPYSISFLDFYKERYGLSIQDRKQPMLVHRTKRAAVQEEICIYLVPELCFMMGLSETLKNDFRVMKEIGENTRLQPNQRQANIEKFLVQLKGNPEAVQIWSSWYDMIFINH